VPERQWREVVSVEHHPGWDELSLECGHVTRRHARASRPVPRRAHCGECMHVPFVYVRMDALRDATWLTPRQRVAAVALAATELCMAEALVLVHGQQRGAERYLQLGRPIIFGAADSPWVPVYPDSA